MTALHVVSWRNSERCTEQRPDQRRKASHSQEAEGAAPWQSRQSWLLIRVHLRFCSQTKRTSLTPFSRSTATALVHAASTKPTNAARPTDAMAIVGSVGRASGVSRIARSRISGLGAAGTSHVGKARSALIGRRPDVRCRGAHELSSMWRSERQPFRDPLSLLSCFAARPRRSAAANRSSVRGRLRESAAACCWLWPTAGTRLWTTGPVWRTRGPWRLWPRVRAPARSWVRRPSTFRRRLHGRGRLWRSPRASVRCAPRPRSTLLLGKCRQFSRNVQHDSFGHRDLRTRHGRVWRPDGCHPKQHVTRVAPENTRRA